MWSPTHVQVLVKRAKGLKVKGKDGTNDAFVTIGLGKEKFRTSTKEKAQDPVDWKEQCELQIPTQGNTAEVQLTVLHRNLIGVDEFLGQVTLPLRDFDHYERPKTRYYELKCKPGQNKKDYRGELEVRIGFTVKASEDVGGSTADLTKKNKGSLSSLNKVAGTIGGSLMSLGNKEKKNLKKLVKSASNKVEKAGEKAKKSVSTLKLSKDKKGGLDSVPETRQWSTLDRQGQQNLDPGVNSDDEDNDMFKFDTLSQRSNASSLLSINKLGRVSNTSTPYSKTEEPSPLQRTESKAERKERKKEKKEKKERERRESISSRMEEPISSRRGSVNSIMDQPIFQKMGDPVNESRGGSISSRRESISSRRSSISSRIDPVENNGSLEGLRVDTPPSRRNARSPANNEVVSTLHRNMMNKKSTTDQDTEGSMFTKIGDMNNRQADTMSVTSRQSVISTASRQSANSNFSRQSGDTYGGGGLSLNSESTVEDTWQPEPVYKSLVQPSSARGGGASSKDSNQSYSQANISPITQKQYQPLPEELQQEYQLPQFHKKMSVKKKIIPVEDEMESSPSPESPSSPQSPVRSPGIQTPNIQRANNNLSRISASTVDLAAATREQENKKKTLGLKLKNSYSSLFDLSKIGKGKGFKDKDESRHSRTLSDGSLGPPNGTRVVQGREASPIPHGAVNIPQDKLAKYAGKSNMELIELLVSMERRLEDQTKKVGDLEDYIDGLLLRVIEVAPVLLQKDLATSKPSISGCLISRTDERSY